MNNDRPRSRRKLNEIECMTFPVSDSLTEKEIRSGLRAVIKDGLASQAMVTLTGGAFLVSFALQLGAPNTLIGLLASIPFLVQLIQIPSVLLVEKHRIRRAITVYASASSRLFWLLIACIPFLFSATTGLAVLIVGITLSASFGAIAAVSWNSWMRDLVPQARLGSFFSKRMSLALLVAIPLNLSAGFFVDCWKAHFPEFELYSYSILFFFGFVAGIVGVYFMSTIPEPRMASVAGKPSLLRSILQPLEDTNFRNLVFFSGTWNLAVNLAAPFFVVYMLTRLELAMSSIIVLTVLSQVTNLAFLRIWGRFSDRFSNKSVLGTCCPLFIVCVFAWTFTTLPARHPLTVPILLAIHAFMGISMAGVTLASGNIALKLAPIGHATAYLAGASLVNSLAAGTAPIVGGILVDFFAQRELSMTLKWIDPNRALALQTLSLQHWDFFFLLSVLVGLFSLHRLAMVQEVGEIEERIVVHEIVAETRRIVRNLSTVGGLVHMVVFPFAILRTTFKRIDDTRS